MLSSWISAGRKLLFFRFLVDFLCTLKYQVKILQKKPLKHCLLLKYDAQAHHVIQVDSLLLLLSKCEYPLTKNQLFLKIHLLRVTIDL